MLPALGLTLLALQLPQPSQLPPPAAARDTGPRHAYTTPPSGDTVGYWQQHVAYTIVATLDEQQQVLRSRGDLVYVNHSPDTLREMWFHQYLNAFRPGSKWSAVDEREGRERFQHLGGTDYGYELFTAVPTFDGTAVAPVYPGAPDSTVVRFRLPRPLAPGDSMRVHFEWDARPSTVPRRQGRRGRTWDFAQWFPKVAVYDRAGWEPNALQPAGELYGEYGDYDVTMVVRDDQVLASTGVPVSGDPGWQRVRRDSTPVFTNASAYGAPPPAPEARIPDGYRAVRFVARDVHHFAWSASPDYRYEGAVYVRPTTPTHYPTWDSVAINVLYKPGDDTTWGGGKAVGRTIFALRWLESIWGTYAYPQMTNVHRLDGGGTEFPMMVMNGDAGQGLILHEGGHVFTYGILGNNEWRSGWMDEGLTSYQTSWALGQTQPERVRAGRTAEPRRIVTGYRANAVTLSPEENAGLAQTRLELAGRAQPIGTNSADFRDFGIYNQMIYGRGALMYSQLRDALGDTAFRAFFHDYYGRWTLKHVDEPAMQGSAERVALRDLSWFFDQWVDRTGLMDYALTGTRSARQGAGWVTHAAVERRGEYRHPMPVGVRTVSGWTIGRADPARDAQTVDVTTAEEPLEVRLDPYHFTWDWDRRNDVTGGGPLGIGTAKKMLDWPFLDQADRDRAVLRLAPLYWYTDPNGSVLAAQARSSYLDLVDKWALGVGFGQRKTDLLLPGGTVANGSAVSQLQLWASLENPYLPFQHRPLIGHRFAAAFLDGILKVDWRWTRDDSRFVFARAPRITTTFYATGAYPTDRTTLPEQWNDVRTTEVGAGQRVSLAEGDGGVIAGEYSVGVGFAGGSTFTTNAAQTYLRAIAHVTYTLPIDSATAVAIRIGGGATGSNTPLQRQIFLSSADPFATFDDHWFRPRGAILKQGINVIPLGGLALRGFSPFAATHAGVAANGLLERRLVTIDRSANGIALWAHAFGDAALLDGAHSPTATVETGAFADAGPGLEVRGRLYDRDLRVSLDFPLFVSSPRLAVGRHPDAHGSEAFRWSVTFGTF